MSKLKKEIPAELEKQLMELGLNNYQARVYRAVHTLQKCSISQIANFSKVPTAKIYTVIRELEEMGLIAEILKSRPAMFKAFPPDKYIETEVNRVSEIGQQIVDILKVLEKEKGTPDEYETLLIENSLLIKNLVLKELKELPQEVFFVIHHDFDFYQQVLVWLHRAIKSNPGLNPVITILDPYKREINDFLQSFEITNVEFIPVEHIPQEVVQYIRNIPFLFIIDEKCFLNIFQTEQGSEYLFLRSRMFSGFLKSILRNFGGAERD